MSAKSIPGLLRGLGGDAAMRRARSLVTILVLIASLAALALITHSQYGLFGKPASLQGELSQTGDAAASANAHPEEGRYRAIAEFLAKRYRVSQDVTFDLVSIAHAAGHQMGLDPLLIIAVMAVESRFNPIAESVAGAKGLMQVIPKYHTDKLQEFGGEKAVFDPQANIVVGSRILKEYLGRTGNLSMALQMYAGALNDEHDIYSSRVMSEKQRLQQVVSKALPATRTASAATVMRQSATLSQ